MTAIAIAAAATGMTNHGDPIAVRERRQFVTSRATIHARITAASGARFGRTRIATAAAMPAVNDERLVRPNAAASATAHAAAAGTSLIGAINMNRTVGLVAISQAAPRPTTGLPIRRPTM